MERPLPATSTSEGLKALPSGMFPTHGQTASTRTGRSSLDHRLHGAQHRGSASHVVLHGDHAVARLERQAAGVERYALTDQRHERQVGAVHVVAQLHERGLVTAALGHGREGAHALVLGPLAVADEDLQLAAGREGARGGGQVVGVHHVGR